MGERIWVVAEKSYLAGPLKDRLEGNLKVKRFCPNPECPSLRITRRKRYLGTSAARAYTEMRCSSCKSWWAWEDEILIEVGTLVLEDYTV